MKNLRTVDLFSGCGGLSLGFMRAGFKIVAAVDNWDLAVKTYRKNFSHDVIECDLSNSKAAIPIIAEYKPSIIIGGPPCQDFSIAGKRVESSRASLTVEFGRIVLGVKPKYFVMENVYSIDKSEALSKVVRILRKGGYGLTARTIDASLVGVPQMRRRYFLIGGLGLPDDCFGPQIDDSLSAAPMTVASFFGKRLNTEYYYAHPRSYNRRAVFSIHEPSATIRRVNRPVPANYVAHPADKAKISSSVRPLTFRERSEIQTFPKSFQFVGSKSQQEHLMANAVPVKLAEFVANQTMAVISQRGPAPARLVKQTDVAMRKRKD